MLSLTIDRGKGSSAVVEARLTGFDDYRISAISCIMDYHRYYKDLCKG